MTLSAGTKLGRYEIRSKIGEGGMGEVYLAEDAQLHRKVALKVLPAEVAANQDRMRRFNQEAQAAAALNHPNIAHTYEIGEANGVHYIAMEYVIGETLHKRIFRGALDLNEVLDIAMQIAGALSAAHSAGITHRDIKPENIMWRHDGYVKALDFGLAKLMDEPQTAPVTDEGLTLVMIKTEPGRVVGTIDYMSPEQARGREVDARTDLFSVGVVLYEMVAGAKPFVGDTKSDVLAAVLTAEPEPLAKRCPGVPAELNRIVTKALRKNREERYQIAREILVDLKSLRQELEFEAKMGGAEVNVLPTSQATSTRIGQDFTGQQSAAPTTISGLFINVVRIHPRRATVTLAIIALVITAAGIGLYKLVKLAQRPESFQTMRLAKLTSSGDVSGVSVAVSPDGKYVVYATREAGEESLWVKHVATSSTVQILPVIEGAYTGVTFSRDGSYLYYIVAEGNQPNRLYQVPVLGGSPRKLIEDAHGPVT